MVNAGVNFLIFLSLQHHDLLTNHHLHEIICLDRRSNRSISWKNTILGRKAEIMSGLSNASTHTHVYPAMLPESESVELFCTPSVIPVTQSTTIVQVGQFMQLNFLGPAGLLWANETRWHGLGDI